MRKYSTTLFWILTDALLIFGFAFFPSFFSIFCIFAAIIFAPIEEWQNIINKYLKKPIKSAVLAILLAFVIALFPLSAIVTGIFNLVTPPTSSPYNSSSVVYYEEYSSQTSLSSDEGSALSELTTSSELNESSVYSKNVTSYKTNSNITKSNITKSNITTSKHTNTSSKTSKPSSSSKKNTTSKDITNSNSDSVYRTPSGKRYHNSPTCGGGNSYEVSFDDAISDGLTPCKKCVK